ncbi:hypothetical protein [uncultured Winogradskyella sp.]|uniref:hypothetical protein n=1 Tax=uncultured Winogradskyella sp. TaxID=395353 RepID=UPI0026301D37|nr:hypothetical protein [uncultured Winogradskyella sp.]
MAKERVGKHDDNHLHLSEELANAIVDNFGYCWLSNCKELQYLAVVRDEDCDKKDNFLIEKGLRKISDDDFTLEQKPIQSLYEIPVHCLVGNKNPNYNVVSVDFINNIKPEAKIPVKYLNDVGDIEPLGLKELKIRPLIAGSSINSINSNDKIGTLGAFLSLRERNHKDDIFFITNYHNLFSSTVIKHGNDMIKDWDKEGFVFQPNNASYDFKNIIGNYFKGQYHNDNDKQINTLDYAIVRLNIDAIEKKIVPHPFGSEISSYNPKGKSLYTLKTYSSGFINNERHRPRNPIIKGIKQAQIGMKIRFHGTSTVISRKTKIRSVNAMVKVKNQYKKDDKLIFKNQVLFDSIGIQGDSGSVLINEENYIVGLLHAGDSKKVSIANNITDIFCNHEKNKQCKDSCKHKIKLKRILT